MKLESDMDITRKSTLNQGKVVKQVYIIAFSVNKVF